MNTIKFTDQVQALRDRAKTGMLIAAEHGCSQAFHFWCGSLDAVHSLRFGYCAYLAESDQRSGGYQAPTDLKAAWAALPERPEKLTMAEVQQLLAAQGVQVAAQPVANGDVNAAPINADSPLLFALCNLLAEYRGVIDPNGTGEHGFEEFEEVIAARAAIAQAVKS